jgi:hypothetical protein
MVERGEGEGRVVLTSDRCFVGAAHTHHAFLVTAGTKRLQLGEVLGAFGLRVDREDLLSRQGLAFVRLSFGLVWQGRGGCQSVVGSLVAGGRVLAGSGCAC